MPQVRSVAFGIWVGVGSRDETPRLAGASHFLEHLLFKGTKRRDALEIAAVMDAVGGEMNAFTAKEYTCYHARVLDTDLPLAVDVLADMVGASLIAASDVESERGVILEEIAMHDDQPDDVVHDAFAAAMFGDHPLGRPVIGTVSSIEAMSRTSVFGYWRRRYRASDMVIAAAGNLDHGKVVRLVRKAFAATGLLDVDAAPTEARVAQRAAPMSGGLRVTRRPTEQAHLVLGTSGIARRDERRYALAVLNNALGGGMSSRLFQEVREKRGLAYSVYSYHQGYSDAGAIKTYVGSTTGNVGEAVKVISEQLERIQEEPVSDEELERTKQQLK